MAEVRYPRPGRQEYEVWFAYTLGLLTLVLAASGLLSALEVLLVGEELSTLGDRLLDISLERGRLHWMETQHGITSEWIGIGVFLLSSVRFVAGVAMLVGRRWGFSAGGFLALAFLGIDLACFSWLPLVVPVVAFDLVGLFLMLRRRAS